jgi:hypothetical protein
VPEYDRLLDSCQKHWNAAVAGIETPKAAMDAIAREHTEIFREAGRLKQAVTPGGYPRTTPSSSRRQQRVRA